MVRFVQFLTSLFGILAGISVFFPYVNEVIGLLCVPPRYSEAAPVLSSLIGVFLILFSYSRRYGIAAKSDDPEITSFFAAIGLIVANLVAVDYCSSRDPWIEVLFLFDYLFIFFFLTGAFSFLAADIYVRDYGR